MSLKNTILSALSLDAHIYVADHKIPWSQSSWYYFRTSLLNHRVPTGSIVIVAPNLSCSLLMWNIRCYKKHPHPRDLSSTMRFASLSRTTHGKVMLAVVTSGYTTTILSNLPPCAHIWSNMIMYIVLHTKLWLFQTSYPKKIWIFRFGIEYKYLKFQIFLEYSIKSIFHIS